MSRVGQILFTPRLALAVGACLLVSACGQRGDLYLPSSEAGKQRTRLPGVVFMPTKNAAQTPAAAASAPQAAASADVAPASKP